MACCQVQRVALQSDHVPSSHVQKVAKYGEWLNTESSQVQRVTITKWPSTEMGSQVQRMFKYKE